MIGTIRPAMSDCCTAEQTAKRDMDSTALLAHSEPYRVLAALSTGLLEVTGIGADRQKSQLKRPPLPAN
jgi:hypothetical protein